MNRNELIITALQQRIGEITSSYELQIAALRAEITELWEEKDAKKQAEEQYSDHLNNITN
jgi:phage host-nuclease inhibitor protein Gam